MRYCIVTGCTFEANRYGNGLCARHLAPPEPDPPRDDEGTGERVFPLGDPRDLSPWAPS